ncbi:FHA domain-containing protein [Microbacterium sp. B2969]|uniref:FHA domain-containing protein n=1 Tax=Microbacterium alkaliflavum TaxID=3248839 RepID=A0ABW7Q8U7_9MICO
MTTQDQARPAHVDPLVLTAPARVGQRIGALVVDALVPVAFAVVAALFAADGGLAGLAWLFGLLAAAAIVAAVAMTARSGRSLGRIAAGTRTVKRSTGAAAGASLLPAFFAGGLGTFDVHRGRDPFAPALAPFEFPAVPAASPAPGRDAVQRFAPVIELDSGERLPLAIPLVLGRNPSAPADAPADEYRWADLSRTLSKSHARLEWDGRLVWVTDLGSTNGTALRTGGAAQPFLAFQRTPIPPGAILELGDRVVTVRVPG